MYRGTTTVESVALYVGQKGTSVVTESKDRRVYLGNFSIVSYWIRNTGYVQTNFPLETPDS